MTLQFPAHCVIIIYSPPNFNYYFIKSKNIFKSIQQTQQYYQRLSNFNVSEIILLAQIDSNRYSEKRHQVKLRYSLQSGQFFTAFPRTFQKGASRENFSDLLQWLHWLHFPNKAIVCPFTLYNNNCPVDRLVANTAAERAVWFF